MIHCFFNVTAMSNPVEITDVDTLLRRLSQTDDRWIAQLHYSGTDPSNAAILTIGIDHQRAVGVAMYNGYDSFVSQGDTTVDDSVLVDGELLYLTDTEPMEFPLDAEIPVKLVQQGIREFIERDGQLPVSIRWADEAP